MMLQLEHVLPRPYSTVWFGFGRDVETGRELWFASDWRPMRDLAEALAADEDPDIVVEVPAWALFGPGVGDDA